MSGDNINDLKMVKEEPLNTIDLEYTKKLLEPFEDVIIEKFIEPSTLPLKCSKNNIIIFIVISLVLLINFPKIRKMSGLNEYILWLISTFLLFGMLY